MVQVATSLDMEFREKDEYGVMSLLSDFCLFQHGGQIKNIISEKKDNLDEHMVFDYVYRTGGKKSRTVYQSVYYCNSKTLGLPEFNMKPENIFHRIGKKLKLISDINFEDYPEFSEIYYLKGEDEELVKHAFDHKILTFFSKETGWHLEGIGYYLIFYKPGKRISATSIPHFLKLGLEISNIFKN